MKSVLISIQPKWCELIASGKKTIEVRKTRPKIETPFKVYIYQTQGRYEDLRDCRTFKFWDIRQKVIGEFVCDEIYADTDFNKKTSILLDNACLTLMDIAKYVKPKQIAYFWHISDLVIYDKPRELSEFYAKCNKFDLDKKEVYEAHCTDCGNKHGIAPCKYINLKWCIPLKRPPQSWCYVEERSDTK